MKLARPTKEQLDKSWEVIHALERFARGLNPFKKSSEDEDEYEPIQEEDMEDIFYQLADLCERSSLSHMLSAVDVLINEENAIIDPNSRTLDLHPTIIAALEDTKRLDWLADPNNHIGNVQLPTECVRQNLHSMRAAIDCAMKISEIDNTCCRKAI